MSQPPQSPPPGSPPPGGPPPAEPPPGGPPPAGPPPGSSLGPGAGAIPAELASRWARLGAAIIDWLILSLVFVLVSIPFTDRVWITDDNGNWYEWTSNWPSWLAIAIAFLYEWLLHATRGQTLGKMALGIRVVRELDGGPMTMGIAAWRSGFQIILGIICCVSIIDYLWILWDQRKQCLHDKVAKTLVVKVRPGDPNPYQTT